MPVPLFHAFSHHQAASAADLQMTFWVTFLKGWGTQRPHLQIFWVAPPLPLLLQLHQMLGRIC
jgi:hypothetical protein